MREKEKDKVYIDQTNSQQTNTCIIFLKRCNVSCDRFY